MWQSVENSSGFNALTLKQVYWKTENFSKKLENFVLVKSTMIADATFPQMPALSKGYLKTKRVGGSTKRTKAEFCH